MYLCVYVLVDFLTHYFMCRVDVRTLSLSLNFFVNNEKNRINIYVLIILVLFLL